MWKPGRLNRSRARIERFDGALHCLHKRSKTLSNDSSGLDRNNFYSTLERDCILSRMHRSCPRAASIVFYFLRQGSTSASNLWASDWNISSSSRATSAISCCITAPLSSADMALESNKPVFRRSKTSLISSPRTATTQSRLSAGLGSKTSPDVIMLLLFP